jgi:hypothetical protein
MLKGVGIDPFKKNLFSGVSTMCLQLGSGTNQPVINCHGFLSRVGYRL